LVEPNKTTEIAVTTSSGANVPTINYLALTSEIVSAFVANNSMRSNDLDDLIRSVHSTLAGLSGTQVAPAETERKEPAVSIKKSITHDFVICLEDGKKFKTMKRHLSTIYNMTPDAYRRKWNLPSDYPMVAPAYAAARSELAKQSGLGVKEIQLKGAGPRVAS
jgi:predicted transcriptional regulator